MQVLSTWHDILEARDPSRLGEILAEDCVFYSPVVHTPQAGRELTALYLTGAMHVFNDSFRYLKEVVDAPLPHDTLEGAEVEGGVRAKRFRELDSRLLNAVHEFADEALHGIVAAGTHHVAGEFAQWCFDVVILDPFPKFRHSAREQNLERRERLALCA